MHIGPPLTRSTFQVDRETYAWPMVAFGTAFSLNFLTLLFERESAKMQLALLACVSVF